MRDASPRGGRGLDVGQTQSFSVQPKAPANAPASTAREVSTSDLTFAQLQTRHGVPYHTGRAGDPNYVKALALLPWIVLFTATATTALAQSSQSRVFDEVAFDQRLNNQVPLDLRFRDESGRAVRLGDYFGDKPVLLSLVYFQCPRLCTLELNGLVDTLQTLKYTAGDEFELLTVSFDPRETPELAADKKKVYLRQYGRPDAAHGWHFLTGEEDQIKQICDAVGFRYMWDEEKGQYGHASGIVILTPDGKVSRYFFGIEYPPRDVQLGIVESSAGKIGSPIDKLVLLCYGYDPSTGKYGFIIINSIRLAGLATVLGLAAFVGVMLLRERRARYRKIAQTTV